MEKIKDNLEWLKVSQLSVGMNIAVPKAERSTVHGGILPDESDLELGEGDIMWDEIVEIKKVGEEQVYDIEVEGTHNFVAGHLIDSNTKEKLSEQEEKEYLNNEDDNKKDVFYGAIFAHNTYISGNVGIGNTAPSYKFTVSDNTANLQAVSIINAHTDGNGMSISAADDSSHYSLGVWNKDGGAPLFYVRGDGNVGIGTSIPTLATTKGLHIDGTTSELHLTTTGGGAAATDGAMVQIWSDNVLYIYNRENAGMVLGTNNQGRIEIAAGGAVTIPNISTAPAAYVVETSGVLSAGGWVDMAEYMPLDSTNYQSGELVSARIPTQQEIDNQLTKESFIGTLSSVSYDSQLIGVISQPGTPALGPVDKENYKAITLVGRVPVKVSTENGPIDVGDYLTSSTTPGVAMKATKPGTVIGKALEEFSNTSNNSDIQTGSILVFVNLTWYDGGFTQILNEVTDFTNAPLDKRVLTIDDLGNFGINATASVSQDLYVGNKLFVDGMDVKDEIEKIKLQLNSQGTLGTIIETSNPLLPPSELMANVFQGLKDAGVDIVNGILKVAQIVVKTLVVEKNPDQTQSSIGEGVIKAEETSVTIESSQIMPTSKIFVTFRSDYGSRWWIGYQEKGRFTVNIAEPLSEDIKFDWWTVQTEQVEVIETVVETPTAVPTEIVGTDNVGADNVGAETVPTETTTTEPEPAPETTTEPVSTTTPSDSTTTP